MITKLDNKYNFNDMLSKATLTRRTLTEVFLDSERMAETANNTLGVMDSNIEQIYKARKSFNDGVGGFAVNGLVAIDANIRKPLFNVYATKHMPMITGGGALEIDKGFISNLVTTEGRLASGSNNKINLVQANLETIQVPIVPIQLGLFVGQIDLMKADAIGYDKIGMLEEAIRYSYQIELDKFAFVGDKTSAGAVTNRGLLNQNITPVNATVNLEEADTEELVQMFGQLIMNQAKKVAYDASKFANKFLIYPELYIKLASPAFLKDGAGTVFKSQLEYLKSALNAVSEGIGGGQIMFDMLPYLSPVANTDFPFDPLLREAGTAGYGRVVLYRQDTNVLRMRLALPLTGGALVYDSTNNGMRKNYVGFIGYPMSFYNTIVYLDNIAPTPPSGT